MKRLQDPLQKGGKSLMNCEKKTSASVPCFTSSVLPGIFLLEAEAQKVNYKTNYFSSTKHWKL